MDGVNTICSMPLRFYRVMRESDKNINGFEVLNYLSTLIAQMSWSSLRLGSLCLGLANRMHLNGLNWSCCAVQVRQAHVHVKSSGKSFISRFRYFVYEMKGRTAL